MKTVSKGFTLMEVMIVVAIVAILATLALPSYDSYIRKSRRVDAHGLLQAAQLAQEKYRLDHTTYGLTADFFSDPAFGRVCFRNPSASTECRSQNEHYVLTSVFDSDSRIGSAPLGTSGYTLTATARGVQAGDTACATIRIKQSVVQTSSGPPAVYDTKTEYLEANCWNR